MCFAALWAVGGAVAASVCACSFADASHVCVSAGECRGFSEQLMKKGYQLRWEAGRVRATASLARFGC
jgi:hypothetical protein